MSLVLHDLHPVDVGVDDVADVGQDVVVDLHPVLDDAVQTSILYRTLPLAA